MLVLPRVLVTGAAGFVGRRLVASLLPSYRVVGIDRLAADAAGLGPHPNLSWHQADLAERAPVTRLFAGLRREGGADFLVHLAAYYDFTGDDHPEYERTNVAGTRHLLAASEGLGLRRFLFASSVAACAFPRPGEAITESTPPFGDHRYAVTKRLGEEMVTAANRAFPTAIVRFAALFSDWCEYLPLFEFLDTWLSRRWNARILGGRGRSAVPYLHVRDLVLCLARTLECHERLDPGEVLIASPDGSTSHRQLFDAVTGYQRTRPRRPLLMPRPLARLGVTGRWWLGRALGREPFERPWMARYIDLDLRVDARRTRERLGWAPRPRLEILRRLPFLLENLKLDPLAWHRRNLVEARALPLRPNLRLASLLERHEEEIGRRFTRRLQAAGDAIPSYRAIPVEEHAWHHRLILRNLTTSVRSLQRAVFRAYCADLAERRARQGFAVGELRTALGTLAAVCREVLGDDPEAAGLEAAIHDYVTVTIDFGIDAVDEYYEAFLAERRPPEMLSPEPVPEAATPVIPSPS